MKKNIAIVSIFVSLIFSSASFSSTSDRSTVRNLNTAHNPAQQQAASALRSERKGLLDQIKQLHLQIKNTRDKAQRKSLRKQIETLRQQDMAKESQFRALRSPGKPKK